MPTKRGNGILDFRRVGHMSNEDVSYASYLVKHQWDSCIKTITWQNNFVKQYHAAWGNAVS